MSESPERSVTITITGTLGDPDDLAAGIAQAITEALRVEAHAQAIRDARAERAEVARAYRLKALAERVLREAEARLAALGVEP